jgi:hypothetical protein
MNASASGGPFAHIWNSPPAYVEVCDEIADSIYKLVEHV